MDKERIVRFIAIVSNLKAAASSSDTSHCCVNTKIAARSIRSATPPIPPEYKFLSINCQDHCVTILNVFEKNYLCPIEARPCKFLII